MIRRLVGVLAAACLIANGCQSAPPPAQLAADQVLRLVAPQDVLTLDPAKIHQPSVGLSLARNVFGGLYRFRDDLVEEPDLATGPPEITDSGLTWTFHLRTNARFSNGKQVKAADVLYSWNRLAALPSNAYPSAYIFDVVAGFAEVQSGRSKTLSGLTRTPDDQTVIAKLTKPAGWWLVELGLWAAAVIDQSVVVANGEETWWSTPQGLVGTGPFKMIQRVVGRSLDFEPVANWWGGKTGNLKQVHVEVVADQEAQANRYRAGEFDIVGYTPGAAASQVSASTVNSFRGDSGHRSELHTRPWFRTSLMGFRGEGRLGTDAEVDVRHALSLALDRNKLADTCFAGAQCMAATGGLITRGLAGYLGDDADPYAKQDVVAAKALLTKWDPTGARLGTLRVGTNTTYAALATEAKSEWQSKLGINVNVEVADSLGLNASKGLYDVIVAANLADYDSPHNWYPDLTNQCSAAAAKPQFSTLLAAADKERPGEALGDYKKVGELVVDTAACPALVYQLAVQLIKPWVKGAGGNALYENYWTGISILKH